MCVRVGRSGSFLAAALCGVFVACDADVPTPNGNAGNGAQGGASEAGAAGSTPIDGRAGQGFVTAGGGSSPIAGAGSGSLGGAGSNSQGGANASAGVPARGTAGEAFGGAAQGGGTNRADDLAAAAVLAGYQLLDPCQASYKAVATPGDVCPQDTAVKNQAIQLQFGGDPKVTYNVTLHLRGVMEGYWYSGGTLEPSNKTFYTGGVPTVGNFSSACKNKTSELPFMLPAEITPTDNCWNGFNMFALTVSAPKQHYFLNYTANKDNDRPPHAVYASDYSVTIPIRGQAKLGFYIVGSDEHQCYNFKQVVSGASTSPSPYIGQFVQFDVRDVTRAE